MNTKIAPCGGADEYLKGLSPKRLITSAGTVEYADFGKGPVIVTLHGAMGGFDQSAILAWTVLEKNFRILAVSRPGYLGTPLRSGRSPEEQADLVAALLDSLGIARAGVIAISGGGPCAITLAHRHAQRCHGIVLISTVAGPNQVPIPLRFHLMSLLARFPRVVRHLRGKALQNLEQAASRSITKPHLCRQMLADEEVRELYSALLASTFHRMGERIAGTYNDIRITRGTKYPLQRIKVPTLVVHGREDPLVGFEMHAQVLAQRISGARLVGLEEGEHAAIFTHRQRVRSEVKEFFGSLGM